MLCRTHAALGGRGSLSPEAVVCVLQLKSRKALEQGKQGGEE